MLVQFVRIGFISLIRGNIIITIHPHSIYPCKARNKSMRIIFFKSSLKYCRPYSASPRYTFLLSESWLKSLIRTLGLKKGTTQVDTSSSKARSLLLERSEQRAFICIYFFEHHWLYSIITAQFTLGNEKAIWIACSWNSQDSGRESGLTLHIPASKHSPHCKPGVQGLLFWRHSSP